MVQGFAIGTLLRLGLTKLDGTRFRQNAVAIPAAEATLVSAMSEAPHRQEALLSTMAAS